MAVLDIMFAAAGLIVLIFGVKTFRRADKKLLPGLLIALGVVLLAVGALLFFLLLTNRLTLPLF